MEWQNKEIQFPDWLPYELKEHFQDHYKQIKPTTDTQAQWEVQKRLLTDHRMSEIWVLFKDIPAEEYKKEICGFFEKLWPTFLDAKDRELSKVERAKIKTIDRKVRRQINNLIETITEVDVFSSSCRTMELVPREVLDGKNSLKNQMLNIREDLLNQLKFYKNRNPPRIYIFLPPKDRDEILTVKKRSQESFSAIFIREAVSIFFRQLFGKPYDKKAYDVSQVIIGKSSEQDKSTPTQKRDRTRTRRVNLRRKNKSS